MMPEKNTVQHCVTINQDELLPLVELFSSIQGEGIYLGEPQVFLRVDGCNMNCAWCDERHTHMCEHINAQHLCDRIGDVAGPIKTISLTGGEPLLYVSFFTRLLPLLVDSGYNIYLETNGTLPDALGEIMPWVGRIAMDIKIPSVTGDRAFWEEHRAFLAKGCASEIFVKIPVIPAVDRGEFQQAINVVAEHAPDVQVILQPVTDELVSNAESLDMQALLPLYKVAREKLRDVRIIPQMHKIWGVK